MRKLLLLVLLLNNLFFVNGQVSCSCALHGLGGYAYQGILFDGKSFKYHGELADTYDDDTYNREFFSVRAGIGKLCFTSMRFR